MKSIELLHNMLINKLTSVKTVLENGIRILEYLRSNYDSEFESDFENDIEDELDDIDFDNFNESNKITK